MKHEYDDGEIVAMAGSSPRHNALALRIGVALESSRRPGCIAFQSDQRIRVLATGKATYPDVSMVCGPIEGDPRDPTGQTITNPTLIVEVLSPTTEHVDRGNKWQHYQRIPSLQEYVLVSQSHRARGVVPPPAVRRVGVPRRDRGRRAAPLRVTLDLARLYAELPD